MVFGSTQLERVLEVRDAAGNSGCLAENRAAGINAALADSAAPLARQLLAGAVGVLAVVAAFKVRHALMGRWRHKLAQASLLARIGPEAFARLETRPPLGSRVSVPPDGRVRQLVNEALADETQHLAFTAEAEPDSNAWAVSARRTSHGGAVICNDSHRFLDVPNIYWQCRDRCPDFDVTGATFPVRRLFRTSASTALSARPLLTPMPTTRAPLHREIRGLALHNAGWLGRCTLSVPSRSACATRRRSRRPSGKPRAGPFCTATRCWSVAGAPVRSYD